jgi:ParB/RepB/Spo0J family partition protein
MAKRKRLILDLADPAAPDPHPDAPGSGAYDGRAPETKAHLPAGFAPPIAQVAGDAAASAALADLAASVAAARADGRLLQRLPLAAIDPDHLVRDRLAADDEELAGLTESIRAHGQRTPIEVAELGHGRYGLISGWRRVTALTRLAATDAAFGTALAMVRRPAHAAEAYVAMVEENEVRAGLSYWERARIAARAADLGVFASEREALRRLFANASRSRRSKIGSFLGLYRALDGVLRFPAALGERQGLDLAQALEDGRVTPERLATALRIADPQTPGAELAVLAIQTARPRPEDTAPAGAMGDAAEGSVPRNVSRAKHFRPADHAPQADHRPELRTELRPGVFLTVTGFLNPTLSLSGPGVDQTFRERLESWVATGR